MSFPFDLHLVPLHSSLDYLMVYVTRVFLLNIYLRNSLVTFPNLSHEK